MGLYVFYFYLQYLAFFIILTLIIGFSIRSRRIALSVLALALLFPVLDVLIPKWSFDYYCSRNLKHVNNGPAINVEGFYSESIEGLCQYCKPYFFLKGYKYLEGKINKKILSNALYQKVNDKHGSLYRFILISSEVDKNDFNCTAPNIPINIKGYKTTTGTRPTHHLCIKPKKLDSIQAKYTHVVSRVTRKQIPFGEVSATTRVIKGSKNKLIYYHNAFSLSPNSIISANSAFKSRCYKKHAGEKTFITDLLLAPKKK